MCQDGDSSDDEDGIPLSSDPDMIPTRIQKAVIKKLKKRFKPDGRPEDARFAADYERALGCYGILARCSYLHPRFRDEILEEDRSRVKELLHAKK